MSTDTVTPTPATPAAAPNATLPPAERLRAILVEVQSTLIEREVEAHLITLSLLAKQNGLLVGEPGVAKSLTIRVILERILGAKKFEVLLGQATPPAAVLGPVSVKGLTNDEYKHITTDMLPEAHIAFLDEIFKANSVTLNSMLSVVNERVFHNGGVAVKIPLWSVIGASNELPTESNLAAFRDRLPWTREVKPVRSDDGFKTVMLGNILRRRQQAGTAAAPTTLTIAEIEGLQSDVTNVHVPDKVLDALADLKRKAESEGMKISSRRYASGLVLCQAQAVLEGRTSVQKSDLTLFEHILWLDLQDQAKAYEIAAEYAGEIQRAVGKLRAALSEQTDKFEKIRDDLNSSDGSVQGTAMNEGVNILSEMKRLTQAIDSTKDKIDPADGEDTRPLDDLAETVKSLREDMRKVIL